MSLDDIFEISLSQSFKQSYFKPKSVQKCKHSSQPTLIKYFWQKIINSQYKPLIYECEYAEFSYIDTLCKQCCIEFIFITNGLRDFFSFINKKDVANNISFLKEIIHSIIMLFNHEFALLFILRNKHLFIELNKLLNAIVYNKNMNEHDDKIINLNTKKACSSFICSISLGIFKMYHKMKKYHLNKISSKLNTKLDLKMNILDLPCSFMENCFNFTGKKFVPLSVKLCGSFHALKQNFGDLFVGIVFSALFHDKYFQEKKCENRSSALRAFEAAANIYQRITDEYLSRIWRGYYHLLYSKQCSLEIKIRVKKKSQILLKQLVCQHAACNRTSSECKLRLCAKCQIAYYCSRQCQKKDWKHFHRNICQSV